MNRFVLATALASLLPLCGASACTAPPLAASKSNPSAEQVIAVFYTRYAELVRRQDEWRRKPRAERQPPELTPPYLQVIEDYPAYLHPSLRQGLIDNNKAELATGGIVALEADPFLCIRKRSNPIPSWAYVTRGRRRWGARGSGAQSQAAI